MAFVKYFFFVSAWILSLPLSYFLFFPIFFDVHFFHPSPPPHHVPNAKLWVFKSYHRNFIQYIPLKFLGTVNHAMPPLYSAVIFLYLDQKVNHVQSNPYLPRLKGVKTIEKPSSGRPKGGRGCLIEVARLIGFYLQYFTNNNFGALITGRLIRGGRLMEVRLYLQIYICLS